MRFRTWQVALMYVVGILTGITGSILFTELFSLDPTEGKGMLAGAIVFFFLFVAQAVALLLSGRKDRG